MNELFLSEGQSIHTFREGDIITRVKKASIYHDKENENLGTIVKVLFRTDGSFMGDACQLIEISNNQIWFKGLTGSLKYMDGPISMPLQDYSEGWELFKCPKGYTIDQL